MIENRTWIILCCCLVDLEKGAKQRFDRQLSINPLVQCIAPCPYSFIDKFLRECPVSNLKLEVPKLFRALTPKGLNRTLTCFPLGIGKIRDFTRLVNERLPTELQLTNPSGHSGRVSLSSIAINNNVGSIEVAAATKHNDGVLGSAALGVAEAIKKRGRDFSIAGIEFDTDEENEEPNSADKLIINNNTNNINTTKKMNYSDGKNQMNFTFNLY